MTLALPLPPPLPLPLLGEPSEHAPLDVPEQQDIEMTGAYNQSTPYNGPPLAEHD